MKLNSLLVSILVIGFLPCFAQSFQNADTYAGMHAEQPEMAAHYLRSRWFKKRFYRYWFQTF